MIKKDNYNERLADTTSDLDSLCGPTDIRPATGTGHRCVRVKKENKVTTSGTQTLHLLEVLPGNSEDHRVDSVGHNSSLQTTEEEALPTEETVLGTDLRESNPVAWNIKRDKEQVS